jgi:hypothetical protein
MKKTYSMAAKFVATMTSVTFAGMACSTGPESPIDEDVGDRTVTLQLWFNAPNESGVREMTQLPSSSFSLAEFPAWERALVVDGAETFDAESVRQGSQIVVPLNTGETATLVRNGDRLELASFTGEDDGTSELPRGAVKAVRMLPDGIDIFLAGSDDNEADSVVRLSGIEDLEQEQRALVTALALQALVLSLEDGEQLPPVAFILAAIAAVVTIGWMTLCGATVADCVYRCQGRNGFSVNCAGLKVSWPLSVEIGGGFSCRCL